MTFVVFEATFPNLTRLINESGNTSEHAVFIALTELAEVSINTSQMSVEGISYIERSTSFRIHCYSDNFHFLKFVEV